MIKYNFRYRGAYEEDKFALSVLNFVNEINDAIEEINEKEDYKVFFKKQIYNHSINDTYIELYRKGAQ